MAAYKTYTDQQLASLLREGNAAAFTEVYNRYWDKLLAVAVNRLHDEQEAEECVQDVFLSVWRRSHTLELRHALSTYLWVAVKYQVINRLNKRYTKKRISTTELIDEVSVPSPEASLLEKELLDRIDITVALLPEKCRMVYRMSREDGKSNKQIAQDTGLSEKTIEGHITRALKDIRTNLSIAAPAFLVIQLMENLQDKFK
jgi:RNA polymerase sigma-70 factor (family 1)